jgi:ATP-binding cassette subfamily B protein
LNVPLKRYGDLLLTYLRPQWHRVVWLVLLLLSTIGLQLFDPLVLRYFIDSATSGNVGANLFGAALLFFGIALLSQVLSIISTYVSTNIGWTATNALRADLARHCLHLDMPFHNARTPGEMIDRLDGDITILSNFFSELVIQVVGNILLLIGVMVLLFQVDWRVGAALGAFVVVAGLVLRRMRSFAVPQWVAARQASAESYGFIEERLAGTEDIRSCGAKAYVLRRFVELMRERLRTQKRGGLAASVIVNGTMLLIALGTVVAFSVSAYLFYAHTISVGTVYLIYYYATMLMRPVELIMQQMDDMQRVGASISRIADLYSTERTIVDGKEPCTASGAMAVAFEHVSFGYHEEEMVLHDLLFQLQPGEVMGLLGRTGSGKTSIARLLLRLYDIQKGAIQLNGQDIRLLPLSDLRQHIGMVTQDVQLFHATVRDNLTLFDKHVPDERIRSVLSDLGLGAWYDGLPAGLDTVLEANGGGLSAGQAQLLALTRIFLADPGLIILDEASSRLDPATEQLLERAIMKLLRNRTAIIIAHRLSTVMRADKILVLEHGRVREFGERTALLDDPASRFSHLVQTELQEVLA